MIYYRQASLRDLSSSQRWMDPKALLKYNTQHKKAVLLIRPFCVEKIACRMSCSLIPGATRCGIFKQDGLPLLPSCFFSYFTENTAQQETRHKNMPAQRVVRRCAGIWKASILCRLIQCLEGLIEVVKNVVDMLCADGQADCVGLNPLIKQFLSCELGMSCGRRVNNQRFHVGNVCE